MPMGEIMNVRREVYRRSAERGGRSTGSRKQNRPVRTRYSLSCRGRNSETAPLVRLQAACFAASSPLGGRKSSLADAHFLYGVGTTR